MGSWPCPLPKSLCCPYPLPSLISSGNPQLRRAPPKHPASHACHCRIEVCLEHVTDPVKALGMPFPAAHNLSTGGTSLGKAQGSLFTPWDLLRRASTQQVLRVSDSPVSHPVPSASSLAFLQATAQPGSFPSPRCPSLP